MSTRTEVAVVGGGLSGIAAALRLADRGRRVTVLESRPGLGGLASSFARAGLQVDNGQHVILRCYARYRELLLRLGVAEQVPIQTRLTIPVLQPGKRRTRIRRGRVGPAPLHLVPVLLAYRALSIRERIALAPVTIALMSLDPDDPGTDDITLGHWLRAHGQGERARALLWGLVTQPALNIEVDRASLALAAKVFRTGLLEQIDAGDIGIPQVPLSALHDGPARCLLNAVGVEVRLRERVERVHGDGEGFVLTTRLRHAGQARRLEAAQVVLALPHARTARLLPAHAAPHQDRWAEGLGASPILNVHFLFDRKVMDVPFAAAPGSPVQWVFDRTAAAPSGHGQYLVTSVSAADALVRAPAGQLVADQLAALEQLLPAVRDAGVLDAFVTREPRATFRQQPGTARLRPPATTAVPGLVLAGAWTSTGWPDTLEGAVRSGEGAADALLAADRPRPASAAAAKEMVM